MLLDPSDPRYPSTPPQEAMYRGRAWYAEVKRDGENMGDVAKRLGLSVIEVSRIRAGRDPVPTREG